MKKYILAAILSFVLSAQAHADIVIGVSLPMTGQAASLGEQGIAGVKAAIEDINAAGGILGQKLTFKLEDDACDPKQAVNATNRLVTAKSVIIIGPACSGAFMAASGVTADEGIPQITPTASNPEITERGLNNIFRAYGRDDQQAIVLSEYIKNNYGKEKIAIIHDKSTWGKGLADGVRKDLQSAGINETLYDAITVGEKDFSTLITKLKAKGVTVALLAVFPVEAGSIVRQSADAKLNIRFMGGDASLVQEFWAVADKTANGYVMSGPVDPRKDKASVKVVKSLEARKINPEIFTLYTYAAIQIAANAIQQAESTESRAIIDSLHKNSYSTVLGKVEFDKKGDLKAPSFRLYQWKNGKYDYLAGAM